MLEHAPLMPSLGKVAFATNKFSEARRYSEQITLPYEIIAHSLKSDVNLVHAQRKIEHITFDQIEVTCAGSFDVAAPRLGDRYLLQFNAHGECLVRQGGSNYLARPGSVFVINPEAESLKSWYSGCKQLMVWIKKSALERVLQREIGYDMDRPLIFDWPGTEHVMSNLAFWHRVAAILMQLKECEEQPSHWRFIRGLEHLFLLDVLTTIPNNYSEDLNRTENFVAPYYVRRVERFLEANLREPITMEDIYEVAGVSPRALFYGFRQFRRTTPMALLKKMRLELARKELLIAAREGGSVTEIAINCGFQNLSMFSREYKARFGEAPSDTLRRGIS
ncbi:MAG TPA: AraC family transcriptional regulator [Sphingomonadales bacterium]